MRLITLTDGAEKCMTYSRLAKSLQYQDRDTALFYAEEGLILSSSLKDSIGIANNSAVLGDLLVMDNQLDDARTNYEQAANFFSSLGKEFDYCQISMILGNISLAQDDYIEALKTYQECLNVAVRNNFSELTPHLYNNIGVVYMRIEEYQEAKQNFEKSKQVFTQAGDLYNSGMSQMNMADISSAQGNDQEALSGYLDVIRIFHEEEGWIEMASAYNNVALLHLSNDDLEKASEYLLLAKNTMENLDSPFDGPSSFHSAKIYTTAARIDLLKGNWRSCRINALEAYGLSERNSYKDLLADNAEMLSEVFDSLGKSDSALFYLRTYVQTSALLKDQANVKELTKLKMQHEFDVQLKQRELADLKKEADHQLKELLYLGAFLFALLVASILVLLYSSQKSKTTKALLKKENLELEKKQLGQDLNYKNKELATNMMYL
ncbi:MAG: tetratricopeptide repeat protein, partial [Flavobacteriales bacterium]|nr:tetratricopeptide repeat protein [Flavobacteriales bacterium]